MTSGDRARVERLVEQAILAPLDLTIRAVEGLPASIDRARQQLLVARFVGRLAVEQGVGELRRRASGADGRTRAGSAATASGAEPSGGIGTEPTVETAVDRGGGVVTDLPDGADLALPDYEQLPAAHIVAKLPGLRQAERDEIERFELANRKRRTILGKLEQLRERP